jgi:hypothetical protein
MLLFNNAFEVEDGSTCDVYFPLLTTFQIHLFVASFKVKTLTVIPFHPT